MPTIGNPVQGYYYDAPTDTLRPIGTPGLGSGALGTVGFAQVTTNATVAVGFLIPNLTTTVTTVAGRRYVVTVDIYGGQQDTAGISELALLCNGSLVCRRIISRVAGLTTYPIHLEFVHAPGSGVQTYTVGNSGTGTAQFTFFGGADLPMILAVEDAGPVTPATAPPPPSYPTGVIARVLGTMNGTLISTSDTNVYRVTAPLIAGRLYRFLAGIRTINSSTAQTAIISSAVTPAGALASGISAFAYVAAGNYVSWFGWDYITCQTSGTYTVILNARMTGGNAAFYTNGNFASIEDMGPDAGTVNYP